MKPRSDPLLGALRPARDDERAQGERHPLRGKYERSGRCRVLATIPRRHGRELRLAIIEIEGKPPLFTIGFFRDGLMVGRNEFHLEDLPTLEAAIAEWKAASR